MGYLYDLPQLISAWRPLYFVIRVAADAFVRHASEASDPRRTCSWLGDGIRRLAGFADGHRDHNFERYPLIISSTHGAAGAAN